MPYFGNHPCSGPTTWTLWFWRWGSSLKPCLKQSLLSPRTLRVQVPSPQAPRHRLWRTCPQHRLTSLFASCCHFPSSLSCPQGCGAEPRSVPLSVDAHFSFRRAPNTGLCLLPSLELHTHVDVTVRSSGDCLKGVMKRWEGQVLRVWAFLSPLSHCFWV